MRIIGNFSAEWYLDRFHINPVNECLTDKAANAKRLTIGELITALITEERHGKVAVDLACKHCEATGE